MLLFVSLPLSNFDNKFIKFELGFTGFGSLFSVFLSGSFSGIVNILIFLFIFLVFCAFFLSSFGSLFSLVFDFFSANLFENIFVTTLVALLFSTPTKLSSSVVLFWFSVFNCLEDNFILSS